MSHPARRSARATSWPSGKAAGWEDVVACGQARLAPTFGRPVSAASPALHPTRDVVAAVAEVRASLLEPARVVITLCAGGETTEVRDGWLPRWSPDGEVLTHLDATGVQIGELHRALTGTAERLAWKADGSALLLVLAEPGSELPGVVGSGLSASAEGEEWTASVASTLELRGWRRLVVLDVSTGALRTVGRPDLNVWNACWAGEQVFALCSDADPTESAWYAADLRLLDVGTGEDRVVARPETQVGALAASPSGNRLAYVESICSDRDLVAGDLKLLDPQTGQVRRLAAPTDVSDVAFVSEDELGFAGLEGLMTRLGFVTADDDVTVVWSSEELSTTGLNPTASFAPGRIASVRAGFGASPQVVLHTLDSEAVLAPLCTGLVAEPAGTVRVHRWHAPDGQEVEGWLHLPAGSGPYPLVVSVHGGPVHSHRSGWGALGLLRPLLLQRGYALLMPNPRGSSGRGQEFARAVVGDMGGADALDITSGITSLVDAGIVDRSRIGVTGGSYGGFMAAWLVTQSDLFAAAVAQHPITDWVQQHGTCCMPDWDELFLDGKPYAKDGQYVSRSPLTFADRVTTPTLFLAGTLDRATPAGQALTMQRALAAHGVPSECVTYPLAAHGPRDTPSLIDSTARILSWIERWMPATTAPPTGEH